MKKTIPLKSKLIPDNAKRVFRGAIYDVYQWDQELYDGTNAVFEMLDRPDTVTTIGIVGYKILLIEDTQPDRGMMLTLPGGRCDESDKTALLAAQREMKEETGYTFSNWKQVNCWQPAMKIEQFIHTFIAWDIVEVFDQKLDSGERITVTEVTLEKLKEIADSGEEPHLRELSTLLRKVDTIESLRALPVFKGIEVDR